jgi:hypothetical protein
MGAKVALEETVVAAEDMPEEVVMAQPTVTNNAMLL